MSSIIEVVKKSSDAKNRIVSLIRKTIDSGLETEEKEYQVVLEPKA